jgi:hypothetical protein
MELAFLQLEAGGAAIEGEIALRLALSRRSSAAMAMQAA